MADETKKPITTGAKPEDSKNKGNDNEVTVPKDLLKQILDKQEAQEELITKQNKEIERLTAAADKGRLVQYDMEHGGGTLIRRAKVSMWQGLPVMGWQTIKDEVGIVDRVLREIQIVKLFCDDGSKDFKEFEVDYIDFVRNTQKVEGEIVEQAKTKSGDYYTIRMSDGKEYKLDIRFIN